VITEPGFQTRKSLVYEPPILLNLEELLPKPIFINSALMAQTMAWKAARESKTKAEAAV
jgi:hypothetical protein